MPNKLYCMTYNELEKLTRDIAYKNLNISSNAILVLFELAQYEPDTWLLAKEIRYDSIGEDYKSRSSDHALMEALNNLGYTEVKTELYTPDPKQMSKRPHRFYKLKTNMIDCTPYDRPDSQRLITIMDKFKEFNKSYIKVSPYAVLTFLGVFLWRLPTTAHVGEYLAAKNKNKYSTHYKIINKMEEEGYIYLIRNKKIQANTFAIVPIE